MRDRERERRRAAIEKHPSSSSTSAAAAPSPTTPSFRPISPQPGPSTQEDRTFFNRNEVIRKKGKKGKGDYLKGRGRKAWVVRNRTSSNVQQTKVLPPSYIYSSPSSSSDDNESNNNNLSKKSLSKQNKSSVKRERSKTPVKLRKINKLRKKHKSTLDRSVSHKYGTNEPPLPLSPVQLPDIRHLRNRARPPVPPVHPRPPTRESPLFRIFRYKKIYLEKYKVYEIIYKVKFAKRLFGIQLLDMLNHLTNLFQQLIDTLNNNYHPDDRARIYINHPNMLYGKPIFIALRPLRYLTVEAIMNAIEKVLNSNENLKMDRDLRIDVGVQRGRHAGGGFKKLVTDSDRLLKKSIIQIPSVVGDFTCIPRAMVVATSVLNNPHNKHIRKSGPGRLAMWKGAVNLLQATGFTLPLTRNINFDEIYKLENHLNVQAIIYDKPFSGCIVYKGPCERRNKIFLYCKNDHCDVISSMTGFLSRSYYCDTCHIPYSNPKLHECLNYCKTCFSENCPETGSEIVCKDCNIQCRSIECFNRHIVSTKDKPSVCERYWRCLTCKYVGSSTSRDTHLCGSRVCPMCKRQVLGVHRCYMRATEPKQTSGKFIFFDFECSQNDVYTCEKGYMPKVNDNCNACRSTQIICGQCSVCTNCTKPICGKERHVPNFVVSQSVCNICLNQFLTPEAKCNICGSRCDNCSMLDKNGYFTKPPCSNTCGFREKIFKGLGTGERFASWLFTRAHTDVTVFAHNGKNYDHIFLLSYLIRNTHSKLSTIYSGTKLQFLMMPEYNIRLLDSMNFFPFSLRKVASAFELPVSKGDFPHRFNQLKNFTYNGVFPEPKYYGVEDMSPADQTHFFEWYNKQKGKTFNFQEQMLNYCRLDVEILRLACTTFRNIIMTITCDSFDASKNVFVNAVDPYVSVTLASLCLDIFRSKFLKENTEIVTIQKNEEGGDLNNEITVQFISSPIGVIPEGGYTRQDSFSKKSLYWLELVARRKGIRIQHALNGGEFKIPETNYRVDGICFETGVLYEYFGCLYHGCPNCFPSDNKKNTCIEGLPFSQRYAMTVERSKILRDKGYQIIEIWEHEADIIMSNISEEEKVFLEDLDFSDRLTIRDSFYGGRTNAIKLYAEADKDTVIRYYDVTSLYPFVNKTCKYPIGHPEIITKDFKNINDYFGICKVKILPPRGLFFPVLPVRHDGKLLFPLCCKCTETQNTGCCDCSEKDRCLTGSWVSFEIQKAISKGYKIIKIYEVYHWNESSQYNSLTKKGGLFSEYIDTFLKIKTEASGFPANCTTDKEKDNYIKLFFEKEGISLSKEKIVKNAGYRLIAKLLLNSFWGRLGMSDNLNRTQLCRTPTEFFDILDDNQYTVSDFQIVNNDTVAIMYAYNGNRIPLNQSTSITHATFTTAHARLVLYEHLDKLGTRVLYHDTDSIIFRSYLKHPELDPPLGNFLGDLTDELDSGQYIVKFVSTGPKSYAYILNDGTEVCKVRGFSLNYTASQVINFSSMKEIIHDSEQQLQNDPKNLKSLYTCKKSKITRDKHLGLIYNKPEIKCFRAIYTKRVVKEDLSTVPYGY